MTTRENDITESFTGDRMSILNEIAARTKERIAEEKFKFPLRKLISQQNSDLAKHAEEKISFLEALKKPGMSYICEVKKASPSKGLIAPDSVSYTHLNCRKLSTTFFTFFQKI